MHILLVEDNPIDVRATRRAVRASEQSMTLDVAVDGDEAIAYLTAPDGLRPGLMLLDLNLPGRDGFDVLRFVKSDPTLKRLPVIVLTTSESDGDVLGAYDLGANAYVSKPGTIDGWHDVIANIHGFWFATAELPPS